MSRFYDEAFKWKLYGMYIGGYNCTKLSRMFKISDTALSAWFSQIENTISLHAELQTVGGIVGEIELLQKQIGFLTAEKALLQKSELIQSISKASRIQAAQLLVPNYGPNIVCRMLNLQKANFYYHTAYRPEMTCYEKRDDVLIPSITEILQQHAFSIGSERIRLILKDRGIFVSKKKILRLVQQIPNCIPPKHRCKKIDAVGDETGRRNLLARQFNQSAPNAAWVSDITDLKVKHETYYLCVVLDLFSRKVIAYQLSDNKSIELTRNTFLQAYVARGNPQNVLFHSDQGTQYTAFAFQALMIRCGIQQSFSNPGVPYDNAAMESFFSHMKGEETNRYTYPSPNELWHSIESFITFYNEKRPHSSIGNIPPAQAENIYWSQM